MNDEVLVVIPTIINHKRRYHLLEQLSRDPNVKTVLLVDNSNCFHVPPEKEDDWAKVEHVRPGCNLNWLASCNLGAAITIERGIPYVCFMNDDIHISEPGFFNSMLETLRERPRAGLVVPRYNGRFGDRAHCGASEAAWFPEDTETQVGWVDGTCMLIPYSTLKTVGLLDPGFRAPGWGADVDYSHRVTEAGLELYVSHRAMVWHHRPAGGFSAEFIYGGKRAWLKKGLK